MEGLGQHWCVVGGVCDYCGRSLCLWWEGLCLLWDEPVPAMGGVCTCSGKGSVPAMRGAYACSGRGLCLLWEGPVSTVGGVYACCGRSLCLLWEEPVPAVGEVCVYCGRSLCLQWEGVCACCGNSLHLLWEGSIPAVGGACVCCGRSLCSLPNLVNSCWKGCGVPMVVGTAGLWRRRIAASGGDQCVFRPHFPDMGPEETEDLTWFCLTAFSFQFIRLCLLLARTGPFNHTRMIYLGRNWLTVLV